MKQPIRFDEKPCMMVEPRGRYVSFDDWDALRIKFEKAIEALEVYANPEGSGKMTHYHAESVLKKLLAVPPETAPVTG